MNMPVEIGIDDDNEPLPFDHSLVLAEYELLPLKKDN